MRIGIDLTATWRHATGLENCAIEMTRALLQMDRSNEYVLFFTNEVHPRVIEGSGNFEPVVIPRCHEAILKNSRMPRVVESANLDYIHFPIFPPPWRLRCPSGWTFADATPWLYPQTMKLTSRWYYKLLGARAIKTSRVLTTFTKASRSDAIDVLGVPPERIHVIYPGLKSIFRMSQNRVAFERVRRLYSLPMNFVLFVGTLEPRKNLVRILSAFRKLKVDRNFESDLVIVGRKGWLHTPIFNELRDQGLARHVHITGYVSDEDLVSLYNMARLLICPSLYEGFGLPCIEGMACGCPVVTSNRGAQFEVTEGCAVHCDPNSVPSIALAIQKAHDDELLRKRLVASGLQRAASFSWNACAEQFLKIIHGSFGSPTCRLLKGKAASQLENASAAGI